MLKIWSFREQPWRVFKNYNFLRRLSTQSKLTEDDVEEIRIPMPWGHIAGKWWGSQQKRPILCVHGWQDNANSFDRLIPLLSPEYSYLAIDLPGHGFSSHLPKGLFYVNHEVLGVFRRIQFYYNWPKLSLLGHSYGSSCSFVFASCYPDAVDFFVGIDLLKPLSKKASESLKNSSKNIEKLLLYDSQSTENSPLYTKSDLLEKWVKGSNNSVNPETCEILMQRGTEETNGLFRLNRDCRVKLSLSAPFTQKENLKLAESVTCNVLFVKAANSPYFESKEDVIEVMNVIKKKAKHFEHHQLAGTHHLHLNNPETVAPVINSFIKTVGGQM